MAIENCCRLRCDGCDRYLTWRDNKVPSIFVDEDGEEAERLASREASAQGWRVDAWRSLCPECSLIQ